PFGGKLKDFIKVFINEVHKLEQGLIININGVNCWITGGLAIVIADLLQGNDIVGVLHHNANLGYQTYSFQNLPNLHINRHLVDHAHQYSICINTAVDLELVLLQQINTLQTLRYLADGGIDDQINNMIAQSIFKELIGIPQLHNLLSDWCIDNSSFSIHILQEYSQ
ncbi:45316_t:CDS:2, partial [Gigaspora margarita]